MNAPTVPSSMSALRVIVRLLWFALAGLVIVSSAYYVWPTPYRYDHMTDGGETLIVRIDRVSGEAEVLLPDQGWVPVADPDVTLQDGGPNGI